MKQTEQLEQLKREYQEIPIPEHGIDGVKAAMERARQKKRLKKRLVSYASMAAAAALVLFVAPEMGLRMFAAGGAAPESANKAQDSKVKDMLSGGINADGAAVEEPLYPTKTPDTYLSGETVPGWSPESMESADHDAGKETEHLRERILADAVVCEKIREEILSQIKFRWGIGEEAFLAMMASSSMNVYNPEEQEYYLNEEGLLVVRYAPGELAPEKYGEIEFVIPDEVWK